MKKDEVPQQNAKAFMGHSKLLYATDEQGRYVPRTLQRLGSRRDRAGPGHRRIRAARADAWQRAKAGAGSTLEYHMFKQRMDVVLLAQSTGFFKWTVRRDLRPGAFQRLSQPAVTATPMPWG